MRRSPGVVVCIAFGLSPAVAAGAEWVEPRGVADPPRLAGEAVVWPAASSRSVQLVAAAADGTRSMAGAVPRSSGLSVFTDLDATPGFAAMAVSQHNHGTFSWLVRETVVAGPLGGLSVLENCAPVHDRGDVFASVAVSASFTAYSVPSCVRPGESDVVITDRASGEVRRVRENARRLRAAGRYVAWWSPSRPEPQAPDERSQVTVWDAVAGEAAYRVQVPTTVSDLDVQADGTTVFSARGGSWYTQRVFRASAAAPVPDPLPLEERSAYALSLAEGSVAFARPGGAAGAELGVLDPGAATPRMVATPMVGGVDFDGTEVTFAAPACRGVAIVRGPARTGLRLRPGLPLCPLRFKEPPRLLRGLRQLTFQLECTGYDTPSDCADTVVVHVRERGRWRRIAGDRWRASWPRVTLAEHARTLLMRGVRLHARVRAVSRDLAGRRYTRETKITLRR